MPASRRLTDAERQSIAKARASGTSAATLADHFGVSLKTIYNAANRATARQKANGSRARVIGLRLSPAELQHFEATLARRGIAHRSAALRRLLLVASDVFSPDDTAAAALRDLSAGLNRVGNNVNQIARRLNEAKLRGTPVTWRLQDQDATRALAALIFDLADQIQDLSRARRRALALVIDQALAPLLDQAGDGSR